MLSMALAHWKFSIGHEARQESLYFACAQV